VSADTIDEIAGLFRQFAVAARVRSPLYEAIATAVAHDAEILALLAAMPDAKRQPNLLLGAVRYLYGAVESPEVFLDLVHARAREIAGVMTVRVTQTNEPGRCSTLLPILARLPQPLALLEVGASAGLCLLPDRYAFDYGEGRRIGPSAPVAAPPPVFACRAGAGTPIPVRNVDVAWRAGLDLHPISLADGDSVRWLEALIWPGEEYRIPRLRAAMEVARVAPPRLVAGDLRADLPALAAQAPPDATLVVFHTAVLGYIPDEGERRAFAHTVAEAGAVWISNEGPEVTPDIAPEFIARCPPGGFLMCVDGQPTAWTDSHGTWVDWLHEPAPRH
jgi:hypothetical protein